VKKEIIMAYSFVILFLSLLSITPSAKCSGVRGELAPYFRLPDYMGGGYVESDKFFKEHSVTFLVFWHAGCPRCEEALEGCERILEKYGESIGALGIVMGESEADELSMVLKSTGVTFPQLIDSHETVSKLYRVAHGEVSLFLINGYGEIISKVLNPAGDFKEIMEKMLAGGHFENPDEYGFGVEIGTSRSTSKTDTVEYSFERQVDRIAGKASGFEDLGFVIGGITRLRLLSVSSNVKRPIGPYGEYGSTGELMSYRVELELKRKLTSSLIIGALLRLSNEGKEVLESGPEYLSSEWGSAFMEFQVKRFSLRLGYYDIYLTPLTLMRWDWNDNPRIGGDAGCGCGASAGVLLMESLEELGPSLRFEGAVARSSAMDFSARLFYGIPVRPLRTKYREYRSTGEGFAHYSMEIAGGSVQWSKYISAFGELLKVGLNTVRTWEDKNSVDFEALGYGSAIPWNVAMLASLYFSVPFLPSISLQGEHVFYNKHRLYMPAGMIGESPLATDAHAGTYGFFVDPGRELNARVDYIRVDRTFYSPFSAISYEPNREGIRVSFRALTLDDTVALSLFLKRLREIQNEHPELPAEKTNVAGCAIDVELDNGFGGSVGWMEKSAFRKSPLYYEFSDRVTLALAFRYRFNNSSYIQLQYQRVNFSTSVTVIGDESTDMTTLYFSTTF